MLDLKTLLEEMIENEEVLNALSEVGVFISNYRTNDNLTSRVWKEVPNPFSQKYRDSGFLENIHPDDRERMRKSLDAIVRDNCKSFQEMYRLKKENGDYRWVYSRGRAVEKAEDVKTHIFVGSDRDITILKETEDRLRESVAKEKQRAEELEILRQISASINSTMDMDELVRRTLKEIGRIIPFDSGSVQILKGSKLQVIGAAGFEDPEKVKSLSFLFPQAGSLSTRAIQEGKPFLSNDLLKDFPAFTQPEPSNIIRSWIGVPLISQGATIGLMALDGLQIGQFGTHHLELVEIIGDQISMAMERSLLHEKAYAMAMTDSLTALALVTDWKWKGRLLFESAIRNERDICIALLDIDRFKRVNDRYGHDKGDIVLKEIARVCSKEIRAMDSICRFGGEEFVLILPETTKEQARLVLDRLREKVGELNYEGIEGVITVSIGFCSECPFRDRCWIIILPSLTGLFISRRKTDGTV